MIVTQAANVGFTMTNGVVPLLSLGIEGFITDPATIARLYNFIALVPLLILAVSASQFDVKFIGILLPLWAGFEMFAGWLSYPDINGIPGSGMQHEFGILVVLIMYGLMIYFSDTVHEKFGIAGPGNKIVKIMLFMMILQASVVFINSSQIFPGVSVATSDPNYTNITLQQKMGSVSNAGGLLEKAIDIVSIGAQIAISSLILFLQLLLSIALFSVVLASVFPWILQAGAIGTAFLVVIQFAIWGLYVIFIVQMFAKPGPDPGW